MYYLVFGILYLISILPFRVLYLISDLIYFFLYRVSGYRKGAVMANLEQAFPEKSEKERREIARKFYLNLSDQIVETIKLLSISKEELQRRFICHPAMYEYLEERQLSCQAHLGHVFNWEWANVASALLFTRPFLVVYKPVKNKIMDRLIRYMRGRFGTILISSKNLLRESDPYLKKDYTAVMVADQFPSNPRSIYWYPFLNKMTSFFKGPEKRARKNDTAVMFATIKKIKRGYYKVEKSLPFEHAAQTKPGEITEAFVKFLEEKIREQPEAWLWSHRRWKRAWNGEKNEF